MAVVTLNFTKTGDYYQSQTFVPEGEPKIQLAFSPSDKSRNIFIDFSNDGIDWATSSENFKGTVYNRLIQNMKEGEYLRIRTTSTPLRGNFLDDSVADV